MAVGTGAISLQEVETEIAGTQTSLSGCIGAANTAGFDPTYYTAPATSLAEFRGYDDNPITLYSISVGNDASTANGACSDYITSPITVYGTHTTLIASTAIYKGPTGTVFSTAGWYSDGTDARYWTGSVFTTLSDCTI